MRATAPYSHLLLHSHVHSHVHPSISGIRLNYNYSRNSFLRLRLCKSALVPFSSFSLSIKRLGESTLSYVRPSSLRPLFQKAAFAATSAFNPSHAPLYSVVQKQKEGKPHELSLFSIRPYLLAVLFSAQVFLAKQNRCLSSFPSSVPYPSRLTPFSLQFPLPPLDVSCWPLFPTHRPPPPPFF